MAYRQISIPPDRAACTFSVSLDGTEYLLRLEWNQRAEKWYLGISEIDGTVIVARVKVVADYPLFASENDARLPPGILVCQDTSGAGLDPHRLDFDRDRCALVYVEAADVAAIPVVVPDPTTIGDV